MKRITTFFVVTLLAFTLFGCDQISPTLPEGGLSSAVSEGVQITESAAVSSDVGESSEPLSNFEKAKACPVLYMLVQFPPSSSGDLDVRAKYDNNYKNQLWTDSYYNLAGDIDRLLWLAPRGLFEERLPDETIREKDSPVILDCNSSELVSGLEQESSGKGYSWARLYYDPRLYEFNRHGDVLLYLDPENPADAKLAVQSSEDLEVWTVSTLPDYGSWFEKELAMLRRSSAL